MVYTVYRCLHGGHGDRVLGLRFALHPSTIGANRAGPELAALFGGALTTLALHTRAVD